MGETIWSDPIITTDHRLLHASRVDTGKTVMLPARVPIGRKLPTLVQCRIYRLDTGATIAIGTHENLTIIFIEIDRNEKTQQKGRGPMNENDIGGLYFVGPGWWAMLDRELKEMYEVDPRLSGVVVEEKYGHTRIRYDECSDDRRDLLHMHEEIIHRISGETCELCGRRGHICEEDGWISCRCKRCQNATHTERRQIQRDTAAEYQTELGKIAAYLPEGFELTEREAAAIRYSVWQRGELDGTISRIIRRHSP